MFNYYQWQSKDNYHSHQQQQEHQNKQRSMKKREQNDILIQNYQKRIIKFLRQMKDSPVVQQDMYEIRKRIRNCDREFNPFTKETPSMIHTRQWQNAFSANTSKEISRKGSARKASSVNRSIVQTPMETFHKEENLISKELDEFEESIANKKLSNEHHVSRFMVHENMWDLPEVKPAQPIMTQQHTSKRHPTHQKRPDSGETRERFQRFKEQIGKVRVRKSILMEGYEFDIEKVMGGRVDRSLQEPKRSINDEESMFPRLIEDQGNLAMQSNSFDHDSNSDLRQFKRSFQIKKQQLYFPKLSGEVISTKHNQSRASSESNMKVHFTALKSMAINAQKKNIKLNNNQTVNFADLWRMFLDNKDPEELSKEASQILQLCQVTSKKLSPQKKGFK